jgi:hypothetical protein
VSDYFHRIESEKLNELVRKEQREPFLELETNFDMYVNMYNKIGFSVVDFEKSKPFFDLCKKYHVDFRDLIEYELNEREDKDKYKWLYDDSKVMPTLIEMSKNLEQYRKE